jgi:ribosomal protein S12 methylthiotransferase accessory factor
VTRVANVTHLDRIGIPVTLAMRPNAASLSLTSGKGVSMEAALVSAAMEALEFYAGEIAVSRVRFTSYTELSAMYQMPDPDLFHLSWQHLFRRHVPETWAFGWDLLNQEEVPWPASGVLFRSSPVRARDFSQCNFVASTNGLASGNAFLEALVAALYEVIERDANTCHYVVRRNADYMPSSIPLDRIPYQSVQELCARVPRAGMDLRIFDLTMDVDVPVMRVDLLDVSDARLGSAVGLGCHLDPEVAMLRAITEAAQMRGIIIAGARDDMYRRDLAQRTHQYNREAITWAGVRPGMQTGTFRLDCHFLV